MSKTYKLIEIVGTSPDNVSSAINNGIEAASKTVKNMDWFEVQEIRGNIDEGGKTLFQVTLKIGFRVDDK